MNIAILLSGGTGSRLGSDIPKQYIEVNGKMIITYSLEVLCGHKDIDGIVIVVADEWKEKVQETLENLNSEIKVFFAKPGDNRQLSIYSALEATMQLLSDASQGDISSSNVFIHDAARPNLTSEMITSYLGAMEGHDGVLPVLPMKDTVYYSQDGKQVSNLLDRSKVFAGQAPEVFNFEKYYAACKALLPDKILTINGSTEPAILADMDIAMIPGDENNYKITTRADLEKFENSLK